MQTRDRPETPLPVSEVARRLGLSPHSVRLLIKRGHLPGFKLGPHWRIWPATLDAALDAAERQARTDEAA